MRTRLAVCLCSFVLLATAPAFALEPYLVKDINVIPQNQSSISAAGHPGSGSGRLQAL
jgi:hypothetical protein